MKRNADQLRRISTATSKAMKRSAAHRQCPSCGRKAALVKVMQDGFVEAKVCRWCDYEIPRQAILKEPSNDR